jgi:ATP-dependent exoDNAse (exonuclease V) alpha subunit
MYHLSVKPISRASGRSVTAAAAYRAGAEVIDQRTGEVHDYTRKRDVEFTEIVLPAGAPAWAMDRSELWSAAELAEKRKDARVGREYEVAIPRDLTREQGIALVRAFALDLSERYGVAVEFSVHRDDPRTWDGTEKGFEGYHAHVLTSTRQLGADGFGGKATPELSDTERRKQGLGSGADEIERTRERWERIANQYLEQAGQDQRIDRRSLEDQGLEREPTKHLGPNVTALERRGLKTDLGDVNRRIEAAFAQGERARRELVALQPQVIDTQTTLAQAVQRRPQVEAWTASLEAGADDFVRRFEAEEQAHERARQRDLERQRQQGIERQQRAQQIELERQDRNRDGRGRGRGPRMTR